MSSSSKDDSKSDKPKAFSSLLRSVSQGTGQVGNAIAQSTTQVGQSLNSAKEIAVQSIVGAGGAAGRKAMSVPKGLGSTVNLISQSPLLQRLTKGLKADWLLTAIEVVDVIQAEATVKELQQKNPIWEPDRIAHQLITDKALFAAGSGLANDLLPDRVLALVELDVATTTALCAELIYQIAAAYGLDLQSSDRQGEALAIFGLSFSGNLAIEAGLGLISNVPLAGTLINASAGAAMIYTLGYGACNFYKTQLDDSDLDRNLARLEAEFRAKSKQYLEAAIDQEIVMDWLFLYVIRASKPEQTLSSFLPDLQNAHLSPASLKEITEKIQSPPSVERLLAQLNSDYALVLSERCRAIAQSDRSINSEEERLLKLIDQKVDSSAIAP